MPLRASLMFTVLVALVPLATAQPATASPPDTTTGTAGIVIDPAGNPVPDAQVQIYILSAQRPDNTPLPPGRVLASPQPVQQLWKKSADESGRFHLKSDEPATGVISVDHPPFAQKLFTISLPDPDLTIQLSHPDATLRGVVRNATTGEPAPHADISALPIKSVEIQLAPGKPANYSLLGQHIYTQANELGEYVLERLPVNTWVTLRATAEGLFSTDDHPLTKNAVVLQPGEAATAPDILVYPGHTLKGRVLDKQTGQPIPNASISPGLPRGAGLLGSTGSSPSRPTAISDQDGNYSLPGLKPSANTLRSTEDDHLTFLFVTATAEGYASQRFTPRAPHSFDEESLTLQHDFELEQQQ
jgi:protocatechuate 3,4-dioxygenase beta subunit